MDKGHETSGAAEHSSNTSYYKLSNEDNKLISKRFFFVVFAHI